MNAAQGMAAVVIPGMVSLAVGCVWWLLPHPVLIVAFGILPFAAWIALKKPFPVVLGFIVFSFFRIHEVVPALYPLRIPQLLALGTLFVIAWHVFLSHEIKTYWCRELSLLTVFFALVTVGMFFATNRGVAISEWSGVYVKIYIMVLATAWLLRQQRDFVLATRLFCMAGLLVGGMALYNKSMGIGLVEGTRVTIGRDIGSILGDPNDLALVLLFPSAFALAMALEKRLPRWERLIGGVGFAVLLMAVIATQSRGGLLGIVSVMGVFSYFRVRSKLILLIGGSLALLILFAVAGINDRASGGAAEEGIDQSAMGRLYAWGAAWRMALDNPLTGVGLKNFYHNYYFYSDHWDGLNHAVHSTWFGVLAETGFLGLGVFVLMVGCTLYASIKTLTQHELAELPPSIAVTVMAIPAGVVGFIVSGTFLTQGFTWPIYLQLALAVAAMRYVLTNSQA